MYLGTAEACTLLAAEEGGLRGRNINIFGRCLLCVRGGALIQCARHIDNQNQCMEENATEVTASRLTLS
jgi:hypothetical protein